MSRGRGSVIPYIHYGLIRLYEIHVELIIPGEVVVVR